MATSLKISEPLTRVVVASSLSSDCCKIARPQHFLSEQALDGGQIIMTGSISFFEIGWSL